MARCFSHLLYTANITIFQTHNVVFQKIFCDPYSSTMEPFLQLACFLLVARVSSPHCYYSLHFILGI